MLFDILRVVALVRVSVTSSICVAAVELDPIEPLPPVLLPLLLLRPRRRVTQNDHNYWRLKVCSLLYCAILCLLRFISDYPSCSHSTLSGNITIQPTTPIPALYWTP
jgi:hypothetical protein